MNVITPFTFENFVVRMILRGDIPWWFLVDVCKALGIASPGNVAARLDDEEKSTLHNTEGGNFNDLGGVGAMPVLINESGLYSAILVSRKPEAKRFKKWITGTVLPSIRKTGSYGVDPMKALNDPSALRGLLAGYADRVIALEAQVAEMLPAVEHVQRIRDGEGDFCITSAAKHIQVRPKELFAFLAQHHWIYRRANGRGWLAYQQRIEEGFLINKPTTLKRDRAPDKIVEQVLVTAKGLAELLLITQPSAIIPRRKRRPKSDERQPDLPHALH